jgi:NAD(P)-dependent dehydrogenase (short-subunit alcohol dehydrogenase family)
MRAPLQFSGRVALVTGAARNIGRSIALAFADAGVDVAIGTHGQTEQADAVVAEARERGARAMSFVGDVGDPEFVRTTVDQVTEELGPVDFLVSNAARRRYQTIEEMTFDDWDDVIRRNLSAAFYLSKLVLPGMAERGFGRIIAVGGPDGYIGWTHRAHNVTSKAGLTGLVKAISFEYAAHGVTANIVVPGGTNTTRDPEDYPPRMRENSPRPIVLVPRVGTTEELADATLYLCSDQASFVTGQSLHVDGGMVMR